MKKKKILPRQHVHLTIDWYVYRAAKIEIAKRLGLNMSQVTERLLKMWVNGEVNLDAK